MNNTHSAFISGEINGSRFTAFVDGIPDKCDHDDLGGNCHETQSGKWITPLTFKNWISYISKMRDDLIYKYQAEIGDPVLMTCVSCSKCKKPYTPDFFNMP